MKCRSVRSECQEHSQKCAPRCRRPLIQILPAFSPQHGCFFFFHKQRARRSLSIAKSIGETAAEWTGVRVALRPRLAGDWWEPRLWRGYCSRWGGGFSWELSADTPSSHIHTCTPLQTQTDLSTLLLAFVSARVRFWTSSVWVVWRCIWRLATWR